MPFLLGPQSNSLEMTIAHGNLVALAIVCLMQYSYSLYRLSRVKKIAAQFQEQVDHLSVEMLQLERERMTHRLENQILRDVLTQTECRKAVNVLLKRFVPNPDDGFAAFVLFDSVSDPIIQSRGLHEESLETLVIPEDVRDQLRLHGAVLWEMPTPGNCPLIVTMHAHDRRR